MNEVTTTGPGYAALRQTVLAQRREARLHQRREGAMISGVMIAAILLVCLCSWVFTSSAALSIALILPVLTAVTCLTGPWMYARSFRRISHDTDDLLNPDILCTNADVLASDLRRLGHLLRARTDDEIAQFVCLSGTTARRLSEVTDVDFATRLHRVAVMPGATPAKRARELAKAFEKIAVDVEGNPDAPATRQEFLVKTCNIVQLWRRCAEDMGLFIPEIVHEDDVPLRGGVAPTTIGSTDVLDVVATRLDDDAVIDRLRVQRQRHESADPAFFTDMDRVETANMLERHLPRLASRFVTAHDTSTGGQRDEVRGVAVASLDMLTSALEDAMDRHAQAARDALQTERRFLEKATVDPWTTAASSPN